MLYTKFKVYLFNILLFGLSISAYGQQMVSHPLTYFGIGDHQLQNHGIYSALGNSYSAVFDSTQLNYLNPGTYGTLSTGNTLLTLGINERISFFSQGSESMVKPVGTLNHLILGFKIKRHFGMAFGIKPYAAKGFYMSEKVFTGVDSIKNTYQGKGYVNDVFVGVTYAPIATKSTYLGFGANLSYLFGSVENQRTSQLILGTTTSGGIMLDNIRVQSPKVELGIAYSQRITDRYTLKLGGTYFPTQSFNATLNHSFYTSTNLNNANLYDTLFSDAYKGKVTQNQNFSIGMTHEIKLKDYKHKSKTLHPNLLVSFQYARKGTVNYQFEGYTLDSLNLSATQYSNRLGVGIEFSPESKLFENQSTLQFFDKFHYRLGAYYGNLPYADYLNNPFQDRGVCLGLGIPLLSTPSLSNLNISVNLGQRGTFKTGSLQENYLSIQLGVIVSPASFERWFRKRKVD